MIQKICSYFPAKGIMATMMLGALSCTPSSKRNEIQADSQQQAAELVTKPVADYMKAVYEADNNLNSDLIKIKDSNEYDYKNRLIKEYEYEYDGEVYRYNLYEYDTLGRSLKETRCYPDGDMEWVKVYEYLPDGITKEITTYDDGKKWVRVTDSDDRIHQAVIYNDDGSVELQYVYAYAPDGTQKEIIYDGQGRVIEN